MQRWLKYLRCCDVGFGLLDAETTLAEEEQEEFRVAVLQFSSILFVTVMSDLTPTSPEFCSPDADLNFLSCDSVIFKIHSKNLEYTCGGFAPAGFGNATEDEMIELSEDSATLQLLFAFVYPRHHPDLEGIDFALLLKVGDAAEKYQVFAAVNICRIRIKESISISPIDVFIFGYKHSYLDIISQGISYLQDIPLEKVVAKLPLAVIQSWVIYYESRRSTIMRAFLSKASSYAYSTDTSSGFGSGPFGSGPFGQRTHPVTNGLSERSLAYAMRRFYEKNPWTTSVEGLKVALKVAFHFQEPDCGPAFGRAPDQRASDQVDEKATELFIRKLEDQLATLPALAL